MFSLLDNDWSNLAVLHKNRLPARAHFVPGASPEAVLQSPYTTQRAVLLNGEWDFNWLESPLLLTSEMVEALPTGQHTISVPMNWQFAGYGQMLYTDMDYPFAVNPPAIPAQNETGVYKRVFSLKDVDGFRFFLRFEGVESAFHLYVNGKQLGYSQGSRMPAEFEITSQVREGENQLCVVVYQYCDGSYLEAQDMWWLGGIIRDVVLLRRPQTYIEDLVLDPDYDVEAGAGVLNLRPRFNAEIARLEICVYDGKRVLYKNEEVPVGGLRASIPGACAWSAECPALYPVLATLYERKGNKTLESVCLPTGFRHIEIRGGLLLLNGQRIFMKGFNRHEYNPGKGRVVSRESTRQDLLLIKNAGLNAVRCSHYPNNAFLYQLCDELGLYVIDECDMEADGMKPVGQQSRLAGNPAWKAAHLDRVERMVSRERNFACVLLWSLGNESGYGENIAAMYHWCKQNEPMRPVHYEGDCKNQSVDVSSSMYTPLGDLAELDLADTPLRPHILCEFCHGMGNGPGGLDSYFELAYGSRRIQGLFAWEFMDHGARGKTPSGQTKWLYGGDFGEAYHNGNFCLDGYIMADRRPSPAFNEYKAVAANVHFAGFDAAACRVKLQNRWDFTALDAARLEWRVIGGEDELCAGTLDLPPVCPGVYAEVEIPAAALEACAAGHAPADTPLWLALQAVTGRDAAGLAAGSCVGQARYLVREADATMPCGAALPGIAAAPRVEETPGGLLVRGEDFSVVVSGVNGWLHNYTAHGRQWLPQGPRLNLFRPYTDNDVKTRPLWEQNHLDSLRYTVENFAWETRAGYAIVKVKLYAAPGAIAWGVPMQVAYTIGTQGEVLMDIRGKFTGDGLPECLPKIGTQALLDSTAADITWRGFGPGENYRDSKRAAQDGIWHSAAEKLGVRYLRPQENGNRTGTRWVCASAGASGLAMAFDKPLDFALRGFSDEMLCKIAHDADLVPAGHWVLNLDYQNGGLGSASCGPLPLGHHRVYPLPFAWKIAFVPLEKSGRNEALRRAQALLQIEL